MKGLSCILVALCLFVARSADAQPPVILSQPQGVTVNNASTATFTVVATNAASYQWLFDSSPIAGATNSTLTLDDVTNTQDGAYSVKLTAPDNSTTNSQAATLATLPGTIIQVTISTYPDGGSSNFTVQLFNHDKPATVANFIHYITSGSYSNTFFDQDTNSTLQAGDYITYDRSSNGLNANSVSTGTNIFPSQVDSEFNVGPLIPNHFGTLAMALIPGESNSASSGFFFNLADNAATLDTQNGGYTVFGRILSGTNILQYFNTLSAPSNGIFSGFSVSGTPAIPVNDDGTNTPTDANFFYCDISISNPPVDASQPAVAITSPAPNAAFTNGSSLTVTGTALSSFTGSNNFGLAEVFCVLTTIAGIDEGATQTNAAIGTTNWSLDLGTNAPGVYQLTAFAQDGAGHLSAPATQYFTNLAFLTIITNVNGQLTTNVQPIVPGQQYSVTAAPGAGELFDYWKNQGVVSLDPVQSFIAETNLTLTVTLVSNTLPAGLAITNPTANSVVQTASHELTISGTLPASTDVTSVTCQLFARSNAVTAALPAAINGATWSLTVSNLTGGPYSVVVVAADSSGQQGLVSENFTALVAPPTIISQPPNLTVNAGSSADFTVIASNAASYQWESAGTPIAGATDATLALNDVSSNLNGSSYYVVITAPDGETVTSAPGTLTVVAGTIVQITISTYPGGGSSNVLVELFNHDKPATVENFIHYITSGSYSNTFLDRDVANFVLQTGDYVATDRTSNGLDLNYLPTGTNRFPSQVDSEFNVGPLIPNTFGTLAMALVSGEPNSATSAFFFNLADNSTNLDAQNGGFTVFGRVISGTNVLPYFNTLSAPSNGIYDLNQYIPTLPVNYDGTNSPTDANLFFCDFKFITPPPVDTTPPIVAITSPSPDAAMTNGSPLTVTGTASDNVGLAEVFCILTSTTGAYGDESQTNAALGTTNWSLDLVSQLGTIVPGIYKLTAYSQDGAGNLSTPATQYFTNLTRLTVITNVNGQLTTNPPQYLVPGQQYSVAAAPGPAQQFYGWTSNGVTSLNPVQTFKANGNLTLTVTYLSTNSSAGLNITSPGSGAQALSIQSVLTVSGTVASANVTGVICQFFQNSNSISAARPANIAGTNWSLTVTNLLNGSNYMVLALGTNASGASALASAKFSLLNVDRLTINLVGEGSVKNNPGPYVVTGSNYTVQAVPAAGQAFYSWNDGVTTTLSPSKTFHAASNLTLTATFVPENSSLQGITFTYPPANAMLTNGTFQIAGNLPASLVCTQMTCQLFLQSNGVTAGPQAALLDASAPKWSFPVTNLAPGSYRVLAVGYDNKGHARLVAENFNLLAKLEVGIQGQGTVTPGLNGKYLEVGKAYAIAATPKAGQLFAYWSGPVANSNNAATTFTLSSNTVLTATFTNNYFPAVAGTYTGLFLNPSGVSPTNAGFITVTTGSTGVFIGDLKFPSVTYTIYYKFPFSGSVSLLSKGLDSNDLQLVLDLDLTNGTDTITGYLADETGDGSYVWVSSIVLYRSVTRLAASNAPAAGKYAVLLQPENDLDAPVATGYATISLQTTGALAMAGTLPDNTAISESAKMSRDGIWPVYIVPPGYKNKGMIIGWQTNSPSGACEGQLFWYKPGTGMSSNLASSGALFAAPLADTQYQLVLAGGVTNTLTVNSARQFVPHSPITAISLLPTGVLSGLIDVNHSNRPFRGAFVSPSAGGGGFFVDTNNQTSGFLISPFQ
jgi:peptidyl-prolyl cis-trans isomerase A (cyclophilin A)